MLILNAIHGIINLKGSHHEIQSIIQKISSN